MNSVTFKFLKQKRGKMVVNMTFKKIMIALMMMGIMMMMIVIIVKMIDNKGNDDVTDIDDVDEVCDSIWRRYYIPNVQ